ncbi:PucC family protein [Streptomyces sp. Qhu_M48]|uniref:PucC family protein n=1 Tax=Streptomyces sp. Qhu_M48 TaxID=3435889 RepID=UPI003F4F9CA3
MSPRNPLPPPPPPADVQSWPDRDARLADRALALDELGRRLFGGGRLVTFLLSFLLLQLGWGLVGVLLVSLGGPVLDPIMMLTGLVTAFFGVGVLVPAVWLTVRGLRRDRTARERLVRWAALDRHGPTDARLRAPVLSVCWLLLSFALCGLGLWTGFAVPAGATRDDGYGLVAYGMGVALILWITGLTGLTKAVGHYRLAVRLTGPRPPAGRSASSGLPRPE